MQLEDLTVGTRVMLASAHPEDLDPPVGVVLDPTVEDITDGMAEMGTDVVHCVLVEWNGWNRRWEYPEDLQAWRVSPMNGTDEDGAPCCTAWVTSRGRDHEPGCPDERRPR